MMAKLRVTWAAGSKKASPAWLAVRVQVPKVRSVMAAPVVGVVTFAAVQTVGVVLATVTVRLGLIAVALVLAGAVKATGAGMGGTACVL